MLYGSIAVVVLLLGAVAFVKRELLKLKWADYKSSREVARARKLSAVAEKPKKPAKPPSAAALLLRRVGVTLGNAGIALLVGVIVAAAAGIASHLAMHMNLATLGFTAIGLAAGTGYTWILRGN